MAHRLFAGRYRLLRRLGGGAQGLAIQVADALRGDALAVLKLGRSGQEQRDGTIAEFEALRMLTTPCIAPVLGLGFAGPRDLELFEGLTDEGPLHLGRDTRAYLVRTWVDGPTVLDWSSGLQADQGHGASEVQARVLSVLAHLTEAIAELHHAGLVHGDLKPEHVLIVEERGQERPALIDFGLAARGGAGTMGGTPGYLAPERLRGMRATEASDAFALGVMLAQVLVGQRLPVRSISDRAQLPGALLERGLPERVIQTIRRLLSADPAQRPELDSVRVALLPPSEAVGGWEGGRPRQLPFLGHARRAAIGALQARASEGRPALPPVVLLVGERGIGRSRMLRQLGWELQHTGRPTLELFGGGQPWQRLLLLGPQLASLSDKAFTPPPPASGDRARWLKNLAEALIDALPGQPVSLLWDDIGEDPIEGLEVVEALILALERAPDALRLWATTSPRGLPRLRPLLASAGFEVVELSPLTREDFDGLLGLGSMRQRLSEGELERLYRRSQGIPGKLTRLLVDDDDAPTTPEPAPEATLLDSPSNLEALVVALCGMLPEGATMAELEEAAAAATCGPEQARATVERCVARRLITKVVPRADAPDQRAYTAPFMPLEQLDGPARRALGEGLVPLGRKHPHVGLLSAALRRDGAALRALWGRHRERLRAEQAGTLTMVILEAALIVTQDPDIVDDFIDTAMASGQPALGMEALGRALAGVEEAPGRARLELARGRLAFGAGLTVEGIEALPLEALGALEAGHRDNILAQLDLRRSRFAEARRRAMEGLERLRSESTPQAAVLRSDLWVTAAAADAMQGVDTDHRELEGLHGALGSSSSTARARARYHAMRAVAAYMQGSLDRATESYRAALEIVDQEGLDSERPVYLLNLGTAYERQGRLSMARQYYELGARCCLPTTRATTRALLLANRANIDIKLGRSGEARELLAAAGRIAREIGLAYITQFVEQLEADADSADGRLESAEAVYARCAATFRELGDKRHACELSLKAGLAAARADREKAAREHLGAAEVDIEEFADLKHRAQILRAELILARGGVERLIGIDRYLRALERALDDGDDLTVLTEARWLMRRLSEAGQHPDPLALRELSATAGRAWRRVALALTPELRQDMARHLDLERLLDLGTDPTPPGRILQERSTSTSLTSRDMVEQAQAATMTAVALPSQGHPLLSHAASAHRPQLRPSTPQGVAERHEIEVAEQFYRMLSLNRRIVGETELERLIPSALEIALALTGAERGFLLLRKDDGAPFEVAFSRDTDGRPIDPDRLELSETIARHVALEGQPVLTDDASLDGRFGQAASVHQLQLTSILCVPIRERERILGCLYLDHRGAPRVFEGLTARMMGSFADQLAVALLGARRVAELRHERDELARAQARIEALLSEKEELLLDLATRCERLEADLARERHTSGLRFNYDHIVAQAPTMRRVLAQVDRIVDTALAVVVEGESGTGKEVIARAIHFNGPRRSQPFVAINGGALAETLLESELYGHRKGAFPGATQDRKGLFEAASGVTLCLDEIGEMSHPMQIKLLRALQEQRIRPVGAVHELEVDVRIVAATHRDLATMVREGSFREDLYYRLATLIVRLPPLRERREDIPLLIRHIMSRDNPNKPSPVVTGQAVSTLMRHPWPGHIRQLENVVRAAMVLCDDAIDADLIASLLPHHPAPKADEPFANAAPDPSALTPGRPPKCSEAQIMEALRRFQGARAPAAVHLGVSLRTFQRYIRKYNI